MYPQLYFYPVESVGWTRLRPWQIVSCIRDVLQIINFSNCCTWLFLTSALMNILFQFPGYVKQLQEIRRTYTLTIFTTASRNYHFCGNCESTFFWWLNISFFRIVLLALPNTVLCVQFIYFRKKIIKTKLLTERCFTKHLQKFILYLSHFFPHKTSVPKSIWNIPGKENVETYSQPSQASKMELFAKIVTDF